MMFVLGFFKFLRHVHITIETTNKKTPATIAYLSPRLTNKLSNKSEITTSKKIAEITSKIANLKW